MDKAFGWKLLLSAIIRRLQVQSQHQVRLTRNTTCTRSWFNRIGTVYLCGSNKVFSSRFCVDTRVRYGRSEEGRRTYRPKRCDYNNKDEVNSPNILSNSDYQTSSKKNSTNEKDLFIRFPRAFRTMWITTKLLSRILIGRRFHFVWR